MCKQGVPDALQRVARNCEAQGATDGDRPSTALTDRSESDAGTVHTDLLRACLALLQRMEQ